MFDKLIGKNIKIIFLDGTKIDVIKGTLKEWDESIKMLRIVNNERDVYINATQIQKLEVLEDE